jgi:hypothetical protein
MRSWVVRLSLLAFVVGFTPPAWAGTLNDLFTFADIPYTFNPPPNPDQPFGSIHAEAAQGQFQGMGNVNLSFHYVPDPEGPGHPLFSPVRFEGVIPELGITENSLLFDGRINNIPEEFPGFLRFPVVTEEDGIHPALGLGTGTDGFFTWDVPFATTVVPAPAARASNAREIQYCFVGRVSRCRRIGTL